MNAKFFNPPRYDEFYNLVDSCVSLGRPGLMYGTRGVGKSYLLGELRAQWRCSFDSKDPQKTHFFRMTPDNPAGVFRSLLSSISSKKPSGNRPSELQAAFEDALFRSKIELFLIDDAECAKPEVYRMLWGAIESVKQRGRKVGCILSYNRSIDLLCSPPPIHDSMPIFDSFSLKPLDMSESIMSLVCWLPFMETFEESLFSDDLKSEQYLEAEKVADTIFTLTGGRLQKLADLAWVWDRHFHGQEPSMEVLAAIWKFRGREFPM